MKKHTILFFVTAVVMFGFLCLSLFRNLRDMQVDYSGFGTVWPLQMFYNVLHGRPWQNSIFATESAGRSVGFLHNPNAFIHANAIHVNVVPYLFAPLWGLRPNVLWLFGIIILWNMAGCGIFAWLILKYSSVQERREKTQFALAVLFGSGILMILNQMAQFLLFAGPFIFAVYYFLLTGRRKAFFCSIVTLCLVSEDAAMTALAFAGYVYFFEPDKRRFAWDAVGFSLPYLLVIMFLVQPASRVDLVSITGTTTAVVLGKISELNFASLIKNLHSLSPVVSLFPGFFLAKEIFGHPTKRLLWKSAGLALIPALPHWGESVVVGGAHHLVPPFCFTYLALLQIMGGENIKEAPVGPVQRPSAVWGGMGLFLCISMVINAPNFPAEWKPALYRWIGKNAVAEDRERTLSSEKESNQAVLRMAQKIPSGKSLVYWVNNRVPGYLVNRNELWQFPDYYNKADYLLIQKDAADLMYSFDVSASTVPEKCVRQEIPFRRNMPMTKGMLNAVVRPLLEEGGTHRVVGEDDHSLLLERSISSPFEVPPQTVGFGWFAGIAKMRLFSRQSNGTIK